MQLTSWFKSPEKLNIILSPVLSGNNPLKINLAPAVKEAENKIKKETTYFQRLSSYELQTTRSLVSGDNIPIKGFNDHLPQITNPAIQGARNKAISKINSLLTKINKYKDENQTEEIVCPYQQTIAKYLGPNYVPPSIQELSYPDTFSLEKALPTTIAINAHYYNVMLTHLHGMSSEAIDTNFPGITSENLGNAFAMPVTTSNGVVYKINEKKVADHLEFAEIVRSIPTQEILDNPNEVAFKLINKFIEINSDLDLVNNMPFTLPEFSLPSLEPIPTPTIDPLPSPRQTSLPITHPALEYIAQPNYFQTSKKQEIAT